MAWLASGLVAGAQTDEGNSITVGVRSAVLARLETSDVGPGRNESGEPGKIFAVLMVQRVGSEEKLAKTVDPHALVRQLIRTLEAHGYRQAGPGKKPAILLTLQYGRGWLSNPYLVVGYDRQVYSDISAVQEVVGLSPLFTNEPITGREAKLQKASYEKLYLRIAAWSYPADPKTRTRLLWTTTMVADDPDHQDLNRTAPAMLAAGAPYFDRDIKERELEISQSLTEGRVNVGTPVVVGAMEAKSVSLSAPAASPGAIAEMAEPKMRFNLPKGAASTTLPAFIQQSGEEIIYPVEQVRETQTRAVNGEFSSRDALERMLAGSGLVADQDEQTGVFVIHRAVH